MDLIFKIAGIACAVTLIAMVLKNNGKEHMAFFVELAGFMFVALMVYSKVADFFQEIKTMFQF